MQDLSPFTLAPFLAALMPTASLVLDLGCGTGRHAHALRQAGLRVHALDLDVDALETARSLYADVTWCAGRMEALPFAAAAFDAVACIDVLHWSRDAEAFAAAWRGAWDVLRPGGLFFARLRIRDLAPRPDGEWFLADRKWLEQLVERDGGEWLQPLAGDGDSVVLLLRKPAPAI
jgi:tellurite methyltransferase